MAQNTLGAQGLDIFDEDFTTEDMTEIELDEVIVDQQDYTPLANEVFIDNDGGDYWYLGNNGKWNMVDGLTKQSMPVPADANWRDIVFHYGPFFYAGTTEDMQSKQWKHYHDGL